MDQMSFEAMNKGHLDEVLSWLEQPHVKEFWDNSQAHKDDIKNFVEGRNEPSAYFKGTFSYWIGSIDQEPYCLLMTSLLSAKDDLPEIWIENLSKENQTCSLDFCIGHLKYLGQGLAAKTLEAFAQYIQTKVDPKIDTFFIDPDGDNPRAKHVYEKAGFATVGTYTMRSGFFEGQQSFLMVKNID